jgi:Uma2 family endonuclease
MATAATEHSEIVSEPDGLYEVIDGRVVEKPMGAYECWLAGEVFDLLNRHVKENSLGRVVLEMIFDFRPTVDRGRRPDVAFVSYERWLSDRRMPKTRSWAVVPDLALEVVSTTNTADEIAEKLGEYFRVGVKLVWMVFPRQLKIYSCRSPTDVRVLALGDELDGEEFLPGFCAPLDGIFEQPEK